MYFYQKLIAVIVNLIFNLAYGKNETSLEKFNYDPSPYNLEGMCKDEKASLKIYLDSWKAAIFQLGLFFEGDGQPKSRKIHECNIMIETQKGFQLVATIEKMKIRGFKDSVNKWNCEDYVQLRTPKENFVSKVASIFDIDLYEKKSEKLCGTKTLNSENVESIVDTTTHANTYNSENKKMHLFFHQAKSYRRPRNNSFRIIVTSYKRTREEVFPGDCADKFRCEGTRGFLCISNSFVCDGHVNCAFPSSGTDESVCGQTGGSKMIDSTSIIIIVLTSMVSFAILICIISSIKNRMNDRRSTRRNSVTNSLQGPRATAPDEIFSNVHNTQSHDNESPLPPYESVILTEYSKDNTDGNFDENELPPNYEQLFPEDAKNSSKKKKKKNERRL